MFKKLMLISIISTCALASRDKDAKINIEVSPNGKYIAVAAATKRPLKKSKSDSFKTPSSCLYSPESRQLIAACENSRRGTSDAFCRHEQPPMTWKESCKVTMGITALAAGLIGFGVALNWLNDHFGWKLEYK